MSFWDQPVSTLPPLCWLTAATPGFLMCVLGTQTWVLLVMLWPSPQSLPLLLLLLFLEEDPGTRGQRCQPLKHKLIIVRIVRTGETLQTEKPAPYWRWTSMKETCRSSHHYCQLFFPLGTQLVLLSLCSSLHDTLQVPGPILPFWPLCI